MVERLNYPVLVIFSLMLTDLAIPLELKRTPSSNNDTNEDSSLKDEKVLRANRLYIREPLDAHLDCDLALITEEVVDGMSQLTVYLYSH
jgi:hypothetical protein